MNESWIAFSFIFSLCLSWERLISYLLALLISLKAILVLGCLVWLVWGLNISFSRLLGIYDHKGLYKQKVFYIPAGMPVDIYGYCGHVGRISQLGLEVSEKMQHTTHGLSQATTRLSATFFCSRLSLGIWTLALPFITSAGYSGIFLNNCITIKSTGEEWVVDTKLEIHQS